MDSHTKANVEHFNKEAAAWDEKPYILEWAAKLNSLLNQYLTLDPAHTTVIDFGCGTGAVSVRLAQNVRMVVGVDMSNNMIEQYNKKAGSTPKKNMVGICENIADEQQFQSTLASQGLPKEYDLIICHMTLHHVADPGRIIAALAKLLCPGGHLAVTDILLTESSHYFHKPHAHHTTGAQNSHTTDTTSATPHEHGVHGSHAEHTVSHKGGFAEGTLREWFERSELQVLQFLPEAFQVTKSVIVDGDEQSKDFPIFLTIAQKEQVP